MSYSKCHGNKCNIRESCERYTRTFNPEWQPYSDFNIEAKVILKKKDCKFFRSNKKIKND